jgi:hypothetical protein
LEFLFGFHRVLMRMNIDIYYGKDSHLQFFDKQVGCPL